MVADVALLRIIAGFVSTSARDCHFAQLLETPSNVDRICRRAYPAHAKSDDADESATASRHRRHYRPDGDENHSGDCRWRAESQEIGEHETRTNSGERGNNREGS